MAQAWVYRPPPQPRQQPRTLAPFLNPRFYLRREAPQGTLQPTEGEHSAVLPVGTLGWTATGERLLSLNQGTGEEQKSFPSLAQTGHQDAYVERFTSELGLQAQTIPAATWSFAARFAESDANAEAFVALSLYVWRPGTGSVVGYLYDSDTALGNEWPLTAAGRVMTFAGAALAVNTGDLLVLEVWCHQVQLAATSYTLDCYYGGTAEVTEGSTGSAASFLGLDQPLALTTPTPLSAIGTRFYFHTGNTAPGPTIGEKSAFYPVGTFQNFLPNLAGPMNPTIGAAETNSSGNTLAQTARQDLAWLRFVSSSLAAQTINAQNWELALAGSETNAQANAFITMSLYAWRPGNNTVVGYLFDCAQTIGTELATAKGGIVASVAGSAMTINNGDILVCEIWRDAVQGLATVYNTSIYWNGGTVFANLATSFPSGAASYVQAADQTLTFSTPYLPRPPRLTAGALIPDF